MMINFRSYPCKGLLVCLFLFCLRPVWGQQVLDWSPNYILNKSDFKGNHVRSGGDGFMVNAAIAMNFSFHMSNYEFMFTKNFNSKVSTTFNRAASFIIAPDTITENKLIRLSQAQFDLQELYARKFRKAMFENKKGVFRTGFLSKALRAVGGGIWFKVFGIESTV